jgi:hypothetical protein
VRSVECDGSWGRVHCLGLRMNMVSALAIRSMRLVIVVRFDGHYYICLSSSHTSKSISQNLSIILSNSQNVNRTPHRNPLLHQPLAHAINPTPSSAASPNQSDTQTHTPSPSSSPSYQYRSDANLPTPYISHHPPSTSHSPK